MKCLKFDPLGGGVTFILLTKLCIYLYNYQEFFFTYMKYLNLLVFNSATISNQNS